jgi:hypothetical protein
MLLSQECKFKAKLSGARTRTDGKQERRPGIVRESAELHDYSLDSRLRDRRNSQQYPFNASSTFNMDSSMRGNISTQ